MSLEAFKRSVKGRELAELFSSETVVQEMIRKSEAGRPAVEAIGPEVERRVGSLDDQQKKLVGRWAKEVLASRGWKTDRKGRVARGHFFNRGTIYRKDGGASSPDGRARLAAAQRIVRAMKHPIMGSEELIADRRENFLRELAGE